MKKKIKSNSDGESDGTSDDDQTTNIGMNSFRIFTFTLKSKNFQTF